MVERIVWCVGTAMWLVWTLYFMISGYAWLLFDHLPDSNKMVVAAFVTFLGFLMSLATAEIVWDD